MSEVLPLPDPVADREGFLKVRAPYFTASATAILFNDHPFLSAADYWIEKFNGTPQEVTDAMMRGHHLEKAVADWFGKEIGRPVYKNDSLYVDGIIAATPDYWINVDGDNPKGELVEIKTTADRDLDDPLTYWWWQVQTQMLCTGVDKTYIVWMDGRLELHWSEVDRDEEAIANIGHSANLFMKSVQDGVMPDWIETEARHIIARYPTPDEDTLELGDTGINLVTDYWGLKTASKALSDEAATVRDRLFELAGNHDSLSTDGKVVATLRPRKVAATFDKARFQDNHPVMYEEYMGEATTTRVLNIPKKLKETIESTTP